MISGQPSTHNHFILLEDRVYLTADDRFRFGGILFGFGDTQVSRYRWSYDRLSSHEGDFAAKTNYDKWVFLSRMKGYIPLINVILMILGRREDPPGG